MIKKLLREVYMLPRGEQRALVLVSFLLLLSVGCRLLVRILPEREPAGMEEFVKESRALMAAMDRADSLQSTHQPPITTHQSPMTRPSASPSSAAPRFTTHHSPPTTHNSPITTHQSPININKADSAQLLPLPGIGPVFAGRIVKYRELLGGYVRIDQLCEVYGFPETTLDLIRDRIVIDSSAIRRILLDTASFRELLRHPYLELEEVKSLLNYRDFKQEISTLMELQQNQVLSDTTLERIGPYLDLRCE